MTTWEMFFKERLITIFTHSSSLIDIGAGLRVYKEKGNRVDPTRQWMRPYLEKIDYQVLDPIPDYHPDIVGDIHALPFGDNTQDAIVCLAVLEHVEDPFRACREMLRALKAGGYCFVYVPFLYYYHAEKGYYKDFWRFTKDSFPLLFQGFTRMEICPVRGAVETWMHLSPWGKYSLIKTMSRILDAVFSKKLSNQVSGFYIALQK